MSAARLHEAENLLKSSFKLSLYEARAYISLLHASLSPREIASAARIPLPRVYDTLATLEEKGFIHETGDGYSAITPRIALKTRLTQFDAQFRHNIKQGEAAGRRLESLLRTVAKRREPASEVVLLRGINTIAGKLLEVLQNSRSVYVTVKKGLQAKEFFKQFAEKLDLGATKVRILVPKAAKLTKEDLTLARKLGLAIRWSSAILFDMVLVDDRDVVIGVPDPLSEELYHSVAVWVRSRNFALSVRESLLEIWRDSS